MATLQSIEQALQTINPTIFQELCDSFLALRNENYKALSRTGSQTGKQKTTRGTPDTFFLLSNGNYIFVEITTDVSTKDKLANDIRACFNPEKSKIPIEKIEEIVLCFNFNIDQDKIEELNQLGNEFKDGITIAYWSLDYLSIELRRNHRDLVHEYLDLPLDTGQIVSLDKFIENYNNAAQAIATPLNNKFLHREAEKEKCQDLINSSDFIILTGASGVGKTKLALEVIKDFLSKNNHFDAYCISYKSYALLDDLYQYINLDKNYLLFVDDANRIDALEQIIGFFRTARIGKLKIIVTVRDYAYQEISLRCSELASKSINISKLTDEQIVDIIETDDFGVKNQQFQKEIVRIADGNPRIAIMASLLALEKKDLYALSDVSDLFDKYFLTFVKDKDEFANTDNLKCLGIIAFFYTIPYKDRELSTSILSNFDIDYLTFVEVINKLEALELVEVNYEYVKIPEQNLANFFFYKSFVKDELLPFDILLDKYFNNYSHRFRDSIIPIHNTFGVEKVSGKIKPKLREYLDLVQNNDQYTYKLLSTFWFYLELETLEYIFNIVEQLPFGNIVEYHIDHKTTGTKDDSLELLTNFFRFHTNLKDALELSFEYIRKCPELFPKLIKNLNEYLLFSIDDEKHGFYRQAVLFELLMNGLEKKDKLLSTIFWELSKTFLGYKFDSSSIGRNYKLVVSYYSVSNNQYIQDIRAKIWQALDLYFDQFPTLALEVLKSYSARTPDVVKAIMEFDLPYVLEIIKKHLTNESFQHCLYVQEQIRWWKENKVDDSDFDHLTQGYINSIYEMYLIMNWDRYRDKESYEFEDDLEYDKLKEAEIRNYFSFKSTNEVQVFFERLLIIINSFSNEYKFIRVIKIIIDENFKLNFDLGYYILDLLIDANIDLNYPFRLEFIAQIKREEKVNRIWQLIESKEFKNKILWQLSFFYSLNPNIISNIHLNQLLETIEKIDSLTHLKFYPLQKYLALDPLIFQKIIQSVHTINNQQDFIIHLPFYLFSNFFDYLGNDLELIKKSYIQQDTRNTSFDDGGEGFLKILKQDMNFLSEYIESLCSKRNCYSR